MICFTVGGAAEPLIYMWCASLATSAVWSWPNRIVYYKEFLMPPKEKIPKKCSNCGNYHFYLWGKSCKFGISTIKEETGRTMAYSGLPDEDSAEYLPKLKSEYECLYEEQAASVSIHDQFKSLENRFQDQMARKMDELYDSFIAWIDKAMADIKPPAGAQAAPPRVSLPQGPVQQGIPQNAQGNQRSPGGGELNQDMDNTNITSTLAALSLSVDKQLTEEKKGNKYRPEYYVQGVDSNVSVKNLDYTKLNHRELIHGMVRVVQNMIRESDPLLSSYVEHLSFVTSLAAEGGFVNEPFLKYDHYIVDKAMRTGSGFGVDATATSRFFHGGNTYAARNLESKRGSSNFRGRGWGARQINWREQDPTNNERATREQEKQRRKSVKYGSVVSSSASFLFFRLVFHLSARTM